MSDWPRVVKVAINSIEHDKVTQSITHSITTTNAIDQQLLSCLQEVCSTTGNLHWAKIIQNFAAAAFYLCFLLWVSSLLILRIVISIILTKTLGQSKFTKRQGFSQERTSKYISVGIYLFVVHLLTC